MEGAWRAPSIFSIKDHIIDIHKKNDNLPEFVAKVVA